MKKWGHGIMSVVIIVAADDNNDNYNSNINS